MISKTFFRFKTLLGRIPILLRVVIVGIIAAIMHITGNHAGVTLAVGLVAAPATRTLGSGNKLYFRQLTKQADGTFVVSAVPDVLGNPAGTWNILGSHSETPWSRLDTGQFTLEPTIVENDLARRTLISLVAPYSSTLLKIPPELDLEDGTILQTGLQIDGDNTKPYFDFIYFQSLSVVGGVNKENVFYCVGQFDRATSFPFKTNTWNVFKVKILSVDSHGYLLASPPSTETRLTGVTFAALTSPGPLAQGTVVQQA